MHDDEDIDMRVIVASIVIESGLEKAVKILISALYDDDNEADNYFREKAAAALGGTHSEKAVDALIYALSDEDQNVRRTAANSLGKIGSEKAIAALISALNPGYYDRSTVARTLAEIESPALISGLTRILKHHSAYARKKAISVIGYYSEDKQILELLKQLAQTEQTRGVCNTAKEAKEKFARKLDIRGHFFAEGMLRPIGDNSSKEGILVHEVGLIVTSAGHFFREVLKYDEGIDGEIEFRDGGRGSGHRVYLQLKSGDSYLERRKSGKEIFRIKKRRHTQYWQAQAYPVLLVIRNSDGLIRWMDVTEYLRRCGTNIRQIGFEGEPFTVESVKQMRVRFSY